MDSEWRDPPRVHFEHDVYCYAVLALVPVSCCTGGVQPQLYADNLKCISSDPGVLLRAARLARACS